MVYKDFYIFSSGIEAELKSSQHYCQTLPNIIKQNGYLELRSNLSTINVTEIEEAIFSILVDYKFMPIWLVEQLLSYNSFIEKNYIEDIKAWISFGLVWCENTITGEYIRPTYLLFEMFQTKNRTFYPIPFNLLTQMVNEQKLIFDILVGNNDNIINKSFNKIYLEKFPPLGINYKSNGTNILYRNKLTSPAVYLNKNIKEIIKLYNIVEQKYNLSPEFSNFSLFTIIKKNKDSDKVKEAFKFKMPNLVIPILRKDGFARSIAIEIELTNKSIKEYANILEIYKNNKIYGYLVFLCNSSNIIKNIRKAYEYIGGYEMPKIYLFENEIPSPYYL